MLLRATIAPLHLRRWSEHAASAGTGRRFVLLAMRVARWRTLHDMLGDGP